MASAGTFPRIRVRGGPAERGRAYGEAASGRIARSLEAYREVFVAYAGWEWPRVREEAARYEAPIATLSGSYIEELRGIALGAGAEFIDLLAVNVRTEVMFAALARKALGARRVPLECSAFAVLPEASSDGHTVLGQNWDWLLHSKETVVLLEAERDDGPNFVTVVEAGLLAKTGMNASGIGLVTNALVTAGDSGAPGIPYHVALRAILDAETITDAHAVLQRGFRSSSANYLIAHRDGIAVDVEAAPGDFSNLFLRFPEDGVLTHTNHFLTDRLPVRDVSLWSMPDSPFRLDRLNREIAGARDRLSLGSFRGFLADHAGHPTGICSHPDPRQARLDRSATVASVLMDLDTRELWVSDGNPCVGPYHRLDYSELLAGPATAETLEREGAR